MLPFQHNIVFAHKEVIKPDFINYNTEYKLDFTMKAPGIGQYIYMPSIILLK